MSADLDTPASFDPDALLARAKSAERSVATVLESDLVAEMQELQRALDVAEAERRAAGASLASGGQSRELAERIEALRAQMLSSTVNVRLRALPRRTKGDRIGFYDLKLAHPPREGNDRDRSLGWNEDTFLPALLRACVVGPQWLLAGDRWERLDEVLNFGQWQTLALAAYAINEQGVDVPFSRAASALMSDSGGE